MWLCMSVSWGISIDGLSKILLLVAAYVSELGDGFCLVLQVFWFSMIVKLLVKVLFLREELSDSRDIEKEEVGEGESETTAHKNGRAKIANGSSSLHEDKKKK